MSIEALLERIAVGLEANTAILEKLEAGREAAIAQLENKTDKPARASRKKADEPAAGNATGDNAGTGSQAGAATPAAETGISEDDLRKVAVGYIQGAGDNAEERKARAANIKSVTDHFGTEALAGEKGIKDGEQRAQAAFYINRFTAGQSVDFSAEYDFAGDPAQSAGDAGADDSMDGIG